MDILNRSLATALQTLRDGGLILYPTDTIWGIGCDATNESAIRKVYQLKKRDDSKSLIILIADEKDILKYTAQPHPSVFDFLSQSDRPTTVIYEAAIGLPGNLVNEDGSIAIRIVKEPFCKTLIRRLRRPLVSTSANVSGEPAPANFQEISEAIKKGVDYVVPYRQDDRRKASPSRIVKMHADGTIDIIRE